MSYQCPLCHSPLAVVRQTWRCTNNHVFDRAKEGYVNLMPVQHKHSKNPGDSQEMMLARREFLNDGYYLPLCEKLCGLIQQYLPAEASSVLDIGCGEGYYTGAIAASLAQRSEPVAVYGLDIAKIAIKYAAKRYQRPSFCVASSHRLPYTDSSVDAIVRVYAPCQPAEMQRVVKAGGIIITVTPGHRHLYQLKSKIYQQVNLHSDKEEVIDGFGQLDEQTLAYSMTLAGKQAFNLLQMTPFAWRTTDEVREWLTQQELFECETDFILRVYRKNTI